MNRHLYLRAYLAGIAVPTVFLLVGFSIFVVARFVCHVPAPIERVLVFPLAIIPNAFGVWNMLYVFLRSRWKVPIGLHGAALPLFLGPAGFVLASSLNFLRITNDGIIWFDIVKIPFALLALAPVFWMTLYYLIWKYLVKYLNSVQGVE